jgi:hypothetical protein
MYCCRSSAIFDNIWNWVNIHGNLFRTKIWSLWNPTRDPNITTTFSHQLSSTRKPRSISDARKYIFFTRELTRLIYGQQYRTPVRNLGALRLLLVPLPGSIVGLQLFLKSLWRRMGLTTISRPLIGRTERS